MNKKSAVIIGITGVLIAFAVGLLVIFGVFSVFDMTQEEQAETTSASVVTTQQEPETIIIVETTRVYAEPDVHVGQKDDNNSNNSNNSNNNNNNSNSNSNNNNSGNNKKPVSVLMGDRYYIVRNTPGGAGLVMRDAPTSDSYKLGVVPEGDRVYVFADDASNKTGYVRVRVYEELRDVECYVLKEYLQYDGSHFYAGSDSDGYMTAHVSYDTPDNAGLNLRAEPDSESELICVIESGENVKIAENSSGTVNGYVKVYYDHPHAGDVYVGWLLEKYLEY